MLRKHARLQRGVTLVELLVALVLSLMVITAALALFGVSSSTSSTSNEEQGIQDGARFAMLVIGTSARQAGYINIEANAPVTAPANWAVEGAANAKVPSGPYGIGSIGAAGNRAGGDVGGDTVAFRYQAPTVQDGSMPDCRGQNPTIVNSSDVAMSVYWVEADVDGEPALKCLSGSTSGTPAFAAQTLVRGVETLRVMYGVDTNNDSIPDRWVDATGVNAIPAVAPATNPWAMVTAVRLGMVIRGAPGSAQDAVARTLYPLGRDFSAASTFVAPADRRLRKVFTATYQLRNPQNWGI